ncbi:hypothetical protein BABINDRAFT_65860 [Babjeviella inositovora NRRL Y-12698]|uniref:SH3 domain-containing protein n=1 Tax=Babjeviella inositovora NRRL Y-12698 TaxID=984486 RepID=A0A1E3QKX1_9ASCO|nr:uncharacterized protein BABINDRAFT_65860 [Babjeviella inositovora NRRL Y-12698]ODQ78349.1 hypothetical protein BABINDRAFT_65860 [Babjeviella inositovora NRRL Y-12698]
MSFKGLKKGIIRAPQNFRQKFNMGETTSDPVYEDAERRFKELEFETQKLSDESKRYFAAVNGMLDHQIGFSRAIEEIYKPISGRLSDPNAAVPEDNPEGIEASEAYRAVVAELQATLKPDLELIDTRIIAPAQELITVIRLIRKMATKRAHKQVDLDRHLNTHKKYADKKEKTPKDEEREYKAQAEVQIAQEEYNYYNDMLKQELPVLFQLEAEFIKPLFVSFYFMQLNIFYTLYNRMEELKIPYFDLTTDIVEAFNYKRGDIQAQTEQIGLTHFKVGHAKAKLELTKRRFAAQQAQQAAPGEYGAPAPGAEKLPAYAAPAAGAYAPAVGGYGNEKATYGQPQSPVAYGQPAYGQTVTSPVSPPATGFAPVSPAPVTGFAPAPMSPPTSGQTCTAIYDYAALVEGDLTFATGAVIQVITQGADGWWTGTYNGQTGSFPGNYVQLNA